MRWKKKPEPKIGDRRIRARFLFWPKTILGETRWLEWAKWEEEYATRLEYWYGFTYQEPYWIENFWMD
jgi:hypothetical protein